MAAFMGSLYIISSFDRIPYFMDILSISSENNQNILVKSTKCITDLLQTYFLRTNIFYLFYYKFLLLKVKINNGLLYDQRMSKVKKQQYFYK